MTVTQLEMAASQMPAQTQGHRVAGMSAWADDRQNQPRPPQRLLAAEGPAHAAFDVLHRMPADGPESDCA